MTVRVSCPFCNTGFDVPATLPAGRVPCPRCGEAVAIRSADDSGLPQPSLNGDGFHPAEPLAVLPPAPSGLKPVLLLGATLFAVVALGIGIWLAGFLKKADPAPPVEKPPTPGATWPPQTLKGLQYLPSDAKVVFAIQPGPMLQYAERTKQDANKVLADGGMPKAVFDWLTEAGIGPDQIDHVAVGVKAEGLVPPFAILLALREPLADEAKFLERLKARRNPDKKLYTLHIAALIADVSMVRVDATKYLFALREENLATATKPHEEGIRHFRPELQESIRKLSPSAFLWLATDAEDWKGNKTVEFLATVGMKQEERWKRFDPKLRATAISLSLEGDLMVRAAVRYIDAPTAAERVKDWTELVTASKGQAAAEGPWATATVPLNPTEATGKMLKRVYTP